MTDEKPVSLRDQLTAELQGWADTFNHRGDESMSVFSVDRLADQLFDLVTAGADFSQPEEGIERTPAQALAFLLDADQHTRLAQLAGLLDAATRGATCFLMDHQGQIEQLQDELAAIPESWRLQCRMVTEAEQFLRSHHIELTPADWDKVKMGIAEEIERTG